MKNSASQSRPLVSDYRNPRNQNFTEVKAQEYSQPQRDCDGTASV